MGFLISTPEKVTTNAPAQFVGFLPTTLISASLEKMDVKNMQEVIGISCLQSAWQVKGE